MIVMRADWNKLRSDLDGLIMGERNRLVAGRNKKVGYFCHDCGVYHLSTSSHQVNVQRPWQVSMYPFKQPENYQYCSWCAPEYSRIAHSIDKDGKGVVTYSKVVPAGIEEVDGP